MRLHGQARFLPFRGGLLLEERGAIASGAYQGEATRRYRLCLEDTGAARVCFEDGAAFHRLDLSSGVALVQHECGPDRYEGRYRVLGPDTWLLSWRVTGPRKRQLITSRFARVLAPL